MSIFSRALTRKELIAKALRKHAIWTCTGDDFECAGCGVTVSSWKSTIDHRAEMVDAALTAESGESD